MARTATVQAFVQEPCDDLKERARAYIGYCIAVETPPRLDEFANILGMSAQWLRRRWRELYGGSAAEHLKNEQLRIAKRLLLETGLSTTEIAYRSSYGTRRSLYRSFRQRTGFTPMQWRERIRVRMEVSANGDAWQR